MVRYAVFQDQDRFWKWSALYTEHVVSRENKVIKLAWEAPIHGNVSRGVVRRRSRGSAYFS